MKIDIDKLTEDELVDLNNRIVARLRFLNHMRAHSEMLEFRIGDRVIFEPEGRAPVVGVLTRYNKKSVTVLSESGQRWNVSPGFLRRAEGPESEQPQANERRSVGWTERRPGRTPYARASNPKEMSHGQDW
jgi:hypothetical protein